MPTVAAIDIGSNAIRLVIAKGLSKKRLEILHKYREPLRLGQDVFENKEISQNTLNKMTEVFQHFQSLIKDFEAESYWAVATSAMRETKNQESVVKHIKTETGVQIDVISGELEAKLVFEAIGNKMDLYEHRNLLIDIGGGSIELSVIQEGKIEKSETYKLGTVRILKNAEKQGVKPDELPDFIKEEMTEAIEFIETAAPMDACIGTGGNMDRLAKLKGFMYDLAFESVITAEEIKKIKRLVLSMDVDSRIKNLGLRPDRADVIVPALIATEAMVKASGSKLLKVPKTGVKDGMLLRLIQEKNGHLIN